MGGRTHSLARQVTDTFERPSDTTQYGLNDRIAATTSNSGTTPLRSLQLATDAGKAFWLTYLRLDTDLDTFVCTIRVHFYSASAPPTAVAGDNAAFSRAFANKAVYLGWIDMPALADVGDMATAVRDDLRLQLQPAQDSDKVYYALEIISGTPTPASAQDFFLMARATDN